MPRLTTVLLALCASSVVWSAPTYIGSSITIEDGNSRWDGTRRWYNSGHEDNETETGPDTQRGQQWDLEGMFLYDRTLTLVGGYNFKAGVTYNYHTYRTGDIFIDVTGDAVYSGGGTYSYSSFNRPNIQNTFGWDYVIHFNSSVTNYSVYEIDSTTWLSPGTDVRSSNPWRLSLNDSRNASLTALDGWSNRSIRDYATSGTNSPKLSYSLYSTLETYGTDPNSPGLKGYGGNNNHYYLQVDLSFLPASIATFHYTMECGNDNLMGQTPLIAVPEHGSPLAMLAGALGLLATIRKRTGKRIHL